MATPHFRFTAVSKDVIVRTQLNGSSEVVSQAFGGPYTEVNNDLVISLVKSVKEHLAKESLFLDPKQVNRIMEAVLETTGANLTDKIYNALFIG